MLLYTVVVFGVAIVVNWIATASASNVPTSVTVTSIVSPPYLMLRSSSNQSAQQYEGYCVDLMAELAEIIGFNYTIKLVNDGKYGQQQADGTWNGMIGELIRGEADLAVAPLTITSIRERVVDFSKPFMHVGISIMIKTPLSQTSSAYLFLKPFSGGVWLCLLAACPVVGLVLFAIARFIPAEKQRAKDVAAAADDTTQFTVMNSLWYSVRTLLQQGTNTDPRSISGRVLSASWWIFVVGIIALYTAGLVAAILNPESKAVRLVPIASADDLTKQSEIKYGTLEAGSTRDFFKQSRIPVYERMWAAMSSASPSVFVSTTEEGVERVRNSNGRYAFLLESAVNDYYNQRSPCDTMKVGDNLDSKGYGIAVKMGSPLRDRISLAVLELLESGYLAKLYKKWWFDKGECWSTEAVNSEKAASPRFSMSPLRLQSVAGLFYLLLGGIILAVIVAVLEYFYMRKKTSNADERTQA